MASWSSPITGEPEIPVRDTVSKNKGEKQVRKTPNVKLWLPPTAYTNKQTHKHKTVIINMFQICSKILEHWNFGT